MKGSAPPARIALLVWGILVPRAVHAQAEANACVFALARRGEQTQATGAVVFIVRRCTQESTNTPFPFKGVLLSPWAPVALRKPPTRGRPT
jgi:hypothetical protein